MELNLQKGCVDSLQGKFLAYCNEGDSSYRTLAVCISSVDIVNGDEGGSRGAVVNKLEETSRGLDKKGLDSLIESFQWDVVSMVDGEEQLQKVIKLYKERYVKQVFEEYIDKNYKDNPTRFICYISILFSDMKESRKNKYRFGRYAKRFRTFMNGYPRQEDIDKIIELTEKNETSLQLLYLKKVIAVATQNFEEAAEIRDKINELTVQK